MSEPPRPKLSLNKKAPATSDGPKRGPVRSSGIKRHTGQGPSKFKGTMTDRPPMSRQPKPEAWDGPPKDPNQERLNKHLAALGHCSRREADEWIANGWVRVNGRIAETGQSVALDDRVQIDPRAHQRQDQRVTFVFVQWLDEAERRDNLTPRVEPPEQGCVQVLTIHGAKGLEWDLVVIPRLVADELPAKPRDTAAWLTKGELPYQFRGDSASLPVFPWRSATTRKELVDTQAQFVEDVKDYQRAEERRLMYVAVTRARHRLLLSGSFWAHHATHRAPSDFVRELEAQGIVPAQPSAPVDESPPVVESQSPWVWPGDPLGSRREVVERAARLVSQAMEVPGGEVRDPSAAHILTVRERAAESIEAPPVIIPRRIPASSLERWYLDPDAQRAALRRPLPQKPYLQALRGTLFHRYVEEHFEDTPSVAFPSLDDQGESESWGLEEWIEAFQSSPFATLAPLAIEQELHVPLAGRIVVCKIDAVFPGESGPHIVDWKTGAMPSTPEDIEAKSLQLAVYRAAWSQWSGTPEESITASFWYAGTSTLLTPEQLYSTADLEKTLGALWGA